ncbi:GNAT family N-acetyltransferase [Oscillospiraceae bacterium NSJ-54]|uniref:GNAT family N-acetyltransferase n=1 Tax=Zongyangia hominis TaxID=2763677 RepID=A0A926EE39_9FIRM|nr:GNAT family N-acetyltransferase [Zongyangia hominis]
MKVKWYEDLRLPEDARMIRDTVFVKEQQFKDEFDDMEVKALHLVLYDEAGAPMATARMFPGEDGAYHYGRIAVLKEYRGQGLGRTLLDELEKKTRQLGGKWGELGAQCRARGFYEKCGYIACGDEYYEEYCPHVPMRKKL